MTEIWKDILGYEGLYQISNLGDIKSLSKRKRTNQIVKSSIATKYCRLGLFKDFKQKHFFIHILVWTNFNGQIPKGMQVDHINNNKLDNRLSNLQLLSPKENSRKSIAIYKKSKLPIHIYQNKKGSKYKPYISMFVLDNKLKSLGTYATIEEALNAQIINNQSREVIQFDTILR